MNKSPRAIQIDTLVYFIRRADLGKANRLVGQFLKRGDRVSREIMAAYRHLEHGCSADPTLTASQS